MRPEIRQAIMDSYRRPVHSHGNVTLPKDWRDAQGIDEGDELILRETDEGTLEVIPPDTQ